MSFLGTFYARQSVAHYAEVLMLNSASLTWSLFIFLDLKEFKGRVLFSLFSVHST